MLTGWEEAALSFEEGESVRAGVAGGWRQGWGSVQGPPAVAGQAHL